MCVKQQVLAFVVLFRLINYRVYSVTTGLILKRYDLVAKSCMIVDLEMNLLVHEPYYEDVSR